MCMFSPEQDPLCTSPNEESGPLANNAPLSRTELEKSEEGREYLARKQGPPEKFWRMGEDDVTLRQRTSH